jgi:hypothetical protein
MTEENVTQGTLHGAIILYNLKVYKRWFCRNLNLDFTFIITHSILYFPILIQESLPKSS